MDVQAHHPSPGGDIDVYLRRALRQRQAGSRIETFEPRQRKSPEGRSYSDHERAAGNIAAFERDANADRVPDGRDRRRRVSKQQPPRRGPRRATMSGLCRLS
jgi:hypothetical protein